MPTEVNDAKIFPTAGTVYRVGEGSIMLLPVQGMLAALTAVYPDLGTPSMTGINDSDTTETVKRFQQIFGQEETGIIDRDFWDYLNALYTCNISAGRYRPAVAL
jgi:murein L,D-transpeptidase YcbB/YkuD